MAIKLWKTMTFEVMESILDEPMRMLAAPMVRFEPGCVVQMRTLNDGNFVCDLSDGTKPIGIIGNSVFINSNQVSFNVKDMLEVWPHRMIFRTNNYEPGDYETGDLLYVSRNGLLTIEKSLNELYPVARVIGPISKGNLLEMLWL